MAWFAWPVSLVTPLAALGVTAFLLVAILSSGMGGYGAGNIFAYHAAFMCAAFVGLVPLGVLSYRADLGRAGNAAFPDKLSRRVLHGTFNLLALFFAATAFLVAFVYHQTIGQKHLPWTNDAYSDGKHSTVARSIHVVLGYTVLAGLALQVLAGLYKFVQRTKYGESGDKLTLHGRVGPVVWLLGLVCIALAAYFEWQEKAFKAPGTTWGLGTAVTVWLGLATVVGLVVAHVHLASSSHFVEPIPEDDDVEDGGDARFLSRRGSSASKRLLLQ